MKESKTRETARDVNYAAKRMGLSAYTTRGLLRDGLLEGFKIRTKWRTFDSCIDRFIKSRSNRQPKSNK